MDVIFRKLLKKVFRITTKDALVTWTREGSLVAERVFTILVGVCLHKESLDQHLEVYSLNYFCGDGLKMVFLGSNIFQMFILKTKLR